MDSCLSITLQTRPPSSVSQSARTHTSHTGCVCALISLGHGCVQEVKNDINTVRFSHKPLVLCLGHQCVVTMGNCLIWISLCMFFFPLIETVTYTCHYMTDRLERFDLKTSKLDLLKKKRHLHLGCLGVSWYISNFNFKVNYPFICIVHVMNVQRWHPCEPEGNHLVVFTKFVRF